MEINYSQIYKKYYEILEFERNELGCKTTELRHLIGRLGEFYCAIHTNGELAHTTNQHGFDVISKKGERISVKSTAQKTGFVSLNKKTLDKFDKLMVLQFIDTEFKILYFGPFEKVESLCRTWKPNPNKYELDLVKLKKYI